MTQYTPMMTHYLQLKEKYRDALVFYRLGDFYEMFFEDAKIASHELDLVLTGRNAGAEERVPMCGVPYHAVTGYIQRLINKGYKVAIVEQLEDPSQATGLVKRDVVRVVTPGTIMEELLDEKSSVFLASLVDYGYGYALAICETTTGETKLASIKHDVPTLIQTLISNDIKEVVVNSNFNSKAIKSLDNSYFFTVSVCDESSIKDEYKYLCEEIENVHLLEAIGKLINYLEITQKRSMSHLRKFKETNEEDFLKMDYATITNLELVQPSRTANKSITLWSFLDKTRSALGSRTLKKWVSKPLRNEKLLNQRLDFIDYLNTNFLKREQLKESLSELYDLERIVARVAYGSANPKDCIRLKKSLEVAPNIYSILKDSKIYPEYDNLDLCESIYDLLSRSLNEDVPVYVNDGGVFKDGYNTELDHYREIQRNGQNWLATLEQKEKEKTGIKTLKIGYNRVMGYYIEISKGALSQIKEEWGYQRKQTLTTGERFITDELKEQENILLHAQEKAIKLENELFVDLIAKIKTKLASMQQLAIALGIADANYALAVISSNHGYVRPQFSNEGIMDVKNGRHPILDSFKDMKYVANDIYMDNNITTLIITGPNMGGKSTYMRQCLLIAIMAQIGCYVPAKSAILPIFDQIFTRIGSTDDILSGQSTFMVEMLEANNALQNATKDSLIVFDEIGRGTSTYDGMALAQAMLEYIDAAIGAKTLFSTHYHELTALENNMERVRNKNVEVHEEDQQITFLYKVKDGKADRSYGVHVASLAKIPESVIERSKELLKGFEQSKKHRNDQSQIIVMEKIPSHIKEIEDIIKKVDPNNITPIEALQLIALMKNKTEGKKE
ncbi:MAG: DNA mismatch repair protein MutS [Erysipelotrichia bacterium]|mgnify:CR=1 FL=1|nr:DNA mismatch repair protein MutS [Erysipelotrichia bacterium]